MLGPKDSRHRLGFLRELKDAEQTIARTIRDIENAPDPRPFPVSSCWWVDGHVSINVAHDYELSVAEARRLVAELVAAIYCATSGGNGRDDPDDISRESGFLDALKGGLVHALDDTKIGAAIRKERKGQ